MVPVRRRQCFSCMNTFIKKVLHNLRHSDFPVRLKSNSSKQTNKQTKNPKISTNVFSKPKHHRHSRSKCSVAKVQVCHRARVASPSVASGHQAHQVHRVPLNSVAASFHRSRAPSDRSVGREGDSCVDSWNSYHQDLGCRGNETIDISCGLCVSLCVCVEEGK